MGLDFSFVVVTRAERVDPLLESVAEGLIADDEARLRAALPWRPASDRLSDRTGGPPARERRGIAGLQRRPEEVGESYCFTFQFRRDEALAEYERSSTIALPTHPGHVAVGCIWCSLCAGEAWAEFRAVAASSEMSRLLERSASVRSYWSRIAESARASALFFDFEDFERWDLLHPVTGRVARPDEEVHLLADGLSRHSDSFWGEALDLAGIATPGSGPLPG